MFTAKTSKENTLLTDPHLLSLIQNAPPFANAYIDSSQYSENVTYLNIKALQLSETCVQYPLHFINHGLMAKDQQIIEEYRGVSKGYRYHFHNLQKTENQSNDTNYSFTFFGELLHDFYPCFIPNLFRTKPLTPTKNHPKLTYNQQRFIDLLPSKMYSSRPENADDELEIDLDNTLYDHSIFTKHEGTRTYDLLVDSNSNVLEWHLQNPTSSNEIQEARLFLDEIKTAYSCMFIDKSLHADTIDCFINEIINHRKNMKIQDMKPTIEINGIKHNFSLLSFYDIDLNFQVFSKNINHSRQVSAILAYVYLLIKELRPKCYKNS